MHGQQTTQEPSIRVWQDERLGQAWRAAYRDGDAETVVTFPDRNALADFLAEHLGLNLIERRQRRSWAAGN